MFERLGRERSAVENSKDSDVNIKRNFKVACARNSAYAPGVL